MKKIILAIALFVPLSASAEHMDVIEFKMLGALVPAGLGLLCFIALLVALTGCDGIPVGGTCGDGRVDLNEVCDDGNNTDGDGCNATCNLSGQVTTLRTIRATAIGSETALAQIVKLVSVLGPKAARPRFPLGGRERIAKEIPIRISPITINECSRYFLLRIYTMIISSVKTVIPFTASNPPIIFSLRSYTSR